MDKQTDKKKPLKLKVENNINFKLIGISSHENDYRIVWEMNQKLGIQLLRVENLIIHNVRRQEDLEFSRYRFDDENRCMKFYLISNRCPDGFLFPEVKNLDYVFQIIGDITGTELKDTEKKLKSVGVVNTAFILQPEKIRGIGSILVI